jgi:[ribosomal protein S18]-alanine N-acetyltransferase
MISAGCRPLRPPSRRDCQTLLDMEHRCYRHAGERFTRRQIRALLANPNACVALSRIGGTLAGWAVGLLHRHGSRTCSGRLYALTIHPDFRGRRLGTRLANRVLQQLVRRGARSLSLEVRASNRAARHLYDRLGFVPAEPLPDYYGPGIHGLRMRKPPGR